MSPPATNVNGERGHRRRSGRRGARRATAGQHERASSDPGCTGRVAIARAHPGHLGDDRSRAILLDALLQGIRAVAICVRRPGCYRPPSVTCRSSQARRSRCRGASTVIRGGVCRCLCLPRWSWCAAGRGPGPRHLPIDHKKAEAQQVYAQIIALDQSLGCGRRAHQPRELRLRRSRTSRRSTGRELVVAKANLHAARR